MADMSYVDPGLCGRCTHARLVISDRGSQFWLCKAATEANPRLRRYPPLPVLACDVFDPVEAPDPEEAGSEGSPGGGESL
jgi:hypothetical protein